MDHPRPALSHIKHRIHSETMQGVNPVSACDDSFDILPVLNESHIEPFEPSTADGISELGFKTSRSQKLALLTDTQPAADKYSVDAHSPASEGEFETVLSPIDLQGIEKLTDLDCVSGVTMAEEYEVNKPKIGPEQSIQHCFGKQPADVLSQARSLFILEQESLEVDRDPHGIPRAVRLAIQNHDEVERTKITRAYLHKYRSDFIFLAQMHSLKLEESTKSAREMESLKRNFDMLELEFVKRDDENCFLVEQLRRADDEKQDLLEHMKDLEREVQFMVNEQIPDWKDTLARYNKETVDARRREEEARTREDVWKASAERNERLANVERQRQEKGTSEVGTQTELTVTLERHSLATDCHKGAEDEAVNDLRERLADSINENQRYRALLNGMRGLRESGRMTVLSRAPSRSVSSTRPAASKSGDAPSQRSPCATPPLTGGSQQAVGLPPSARWQLRETCIQNSHAFQHSFDALRRKRENRHEKEDKYRRLHEVAHQVLYRAPLPYVSYDSGVSQLESIIKG